MTPEREAVAPSDDLARRLIDRLRRHQSNDYGCQDCYGDVMEEAATELTRLRAALATAERRRASAVEQYERTHQELMGYVVRAEELGARAASLEALLTEAGPELGEMAAAADAFPRYADHARVTVAMGACRRARALLTRIEAREGGEEKGR